MFLYAWFLLATPLVISSALATPCDDAAFSAIPEPALPAKGKGVATGEATLDGRKVLGVRFSMVSDKPLAAWKKILSEAEKQDEWVPDRFGYDFNEWIDKDNIYLRVDLSLVFGAVHVRRQLVALIREEDTGSTYTSCYKMIDHTPFDAKIAAWVTDAEWEKANAGWWHVRQDGDRVLVGYQWWTEAGKIPVAVMKYGMSTALPDVMDAFDTYAGQVGVK